jgi:AraC family transcriptional regulator
MKVIVFVKATPESEAGVMPTEELLTAMGKFNEELVDAGIMLAGEGLKPSSAGARVHFSGTKRTVIDGPFSETKELVAGFWIWQVTSLAEAIEWVKRCPNPMLSDSDIDIRPIYSAEDFGELLTPELRKQEDRLREATEKLAAGDPTPATPTSSEQQHGSAVATKLDPPRFEQGSEMRIAGLSATYTLETRKNIPAQWERFQRFEKTIPGRIGEASYGVTSNFDGTNSFDYLCGVEVDETNDLPDGLTRIRVPAQRYAVFTYRGPVSGIEAAFESIWRQWLPTSGCRTVKTPCVECYSKDFDPTTNQGTVEFWIPIST